MSHDVILRPRAGLAHAAAFVALALAAGCGQGGPATAPVVGTVTLDGRPLAGALVLFQPSQGVPARGITDDDGGFSLTTFASFASWRTLARIACFSSHIATFLPIRPFATLIRALASVISVLSISSGLTTITAVLAHTSIATILALATFTAI